MFTFDKNFIQVINDWQIGSSRTRALALVKVCKFLPSKYKAPPKDCYRRLDLKKDGVFSLVGKSYLPEKISSWSTDVDVAKSFYKGVSHDVSSTISIVLLHRPQDDEVVVNIDSLYECKDFNNAVSFFRGAIKNFHKGIGKYGNSQREVVIDLHSVDRDDVFLLGGRSGKVCVKYGGMLFSNRDFNLVYNYHDNTVFVYKWISHEKTRNILMRNDNVPYNVFLKKYGIDNDLFSKYKKIRAINGEGN